MRWFCIGSFYRCRRIEYVPESLNQIEGYLYVRILGK